MSEKNILKAVNQRLVPDLYKSSAADTCRTREKIFEQILEECKWPTEGWSDDMIEEFIRFLSTLDSNNFQKKCGLGEREGRVFSGLVARRHYNFSHGIGRSGNLAEAQPKAIGSTILSNLTNELALDALRKIGLVSCQGCLVVPMATGMTLMLSLLHLKKSRPAGAKYVLWSRIDQKSCLKCILSAGLEPVIIHTKRDESGQLVTDVDEFRKQIQSIGALQIVCIFSCTSCFAPRATDKVVSLAKLAASFDIPHLINNAYGLTSSFAVHQIEQACRKGGRVDLYVQSTDKNFLVPVGGAIVASPTASMISGLAKMYPGRGCSSQSLDLLITLLAMGSTGYRKLTEERKSNFEYLKERLNGVCQQRSQLSVIPSKDNRISISVAIELPDEKVTAIGSKLFTRHVMGARAVPRQCLAEVEGIKFESWGNHSNDLMPAYLTVAAAIGMKREEVDQFIEKLEGVL